MSPLWKDSYRPLFLASAAWGALGMAAWAAALAGLVALPVTLHAELMVWGVLGGGVLGFAGTAYPRQNDAAPPSPRVMGIAAGLHLLTFTALAASPWLPVLAPVTTVSGALLWLGALLWVIPVARASLARKWDGTTFAVPVTLLVALVAWLFVRQHPTPSVGIDLALHGFLVPLALSVLDRVLPFFSRTIPGYAGVRRPWFAPVFLALSVTRGLAGLLSLPTAPLDLGLLVTLGHAWLGWGPRVGMRAPMVAVLHVGIAWLFVGYAVDLAGTALPRSLAVHVWLAGGMATLLFGVATRVTLGHGGQPIAMGPPLKVGLGLLTAAALLRAVAPVLGAPPALYVLAASLLAAAFAAWIVGYARYLVR